MAKSKKDKEAGEAAAVLDITSKIATLVAEADGDLSALELEGKSSSELAVIFSDLTHAAEATAKAEAEATAKAEAEATAKAEAEATAKAEAEAAKKTRGLPQSREYSTSKDKAPAAAEASESKAKPTGNTLENISINRRRIKCVDLAVGDTYELTEDDLEDESLMAKVNRAVELGVLARS